jgi:hypothetical protein
MEAPRASEWQIRRHQRTAGAGLESEPPPTKTCIKLMAVASSSTGRNTSKVVGRKHVEIGQVPQQVQQAKRQGQARVGRPKRLRQRASELKMATAILRLRSRTLAFYTVCGKSVPACVCWKWWSDHKKQSSRPSSNPRAVFRHSDVAKPHHDPSRFPFQISAGLLSKHAIAWTCWQCVNRSSQKAYMSGNEKQAEKRQGLKRGGGALALMSWLTFQASTGCKLGGAIVIGRALITPARQL